MGFTPKNTLPLCTHIWSMVNEENPCLKKISLSFFHYLLVFVVHSFKALHFICTKWHIKTPSWKKTLFLVHHIFIIYFSSSSLKKHFVFSIFHTASSLIIFLLKQKNWIFLFVFFFHILYFKSPIYLKKKNKRKSY